ncbi:MAG: hypothetical protein GX792_02565, partial [Bacteroidales bacterium]|nr:hypothetical protein [Bacteroidales bacterium]
MNYHFFSNLKSRTELFFFILLFSFFAIGSAGANPGKEKIPENPDKSKQKANLELILKVLPPDQLDENSAFDARGRLSFADRTFTDWLERTGELPPDFDRMPSLPFLPDPLV